MTGIRTGFVVKLLERTLVAFVTGFWGGYEASGGMWDKAGVAGGLSGGLTAVYGLVTKPLNDSSRPGITE